MYAALVVSIWAQMEHSLKSVLRICDLALDKRQRALIKAKTFCDEMLAANKSTVAIRECIDAMRVIQACTPYALMIWPIP